MILQLRPRQPIDRDQMIGACRGAVGGRGRVAPKAPHSPDRGPNARNCGRSSRAGAVSIGPSALNRRTGLIFSPVRSHCIVGSQPSVPRRHHCPSAARFGAHLHALRGQSGRLPALGVAGWRIWRV
jgi:hypothetical protein